jgi:hypothetical protein
MNECLSGLDGRSPSRVEQPRGEVMVEPEAVAALLRLRAFDLGSKRIARELGISRGTVKRYIEAGGWQPFRQPTRRKLLDGLDDWLRERLRRHRGNAPLPGPTWCARSCWPRRAPRFASRRPAAIPGRPPFGIEGCGRRPQRAASCQSTSATTPSGSCATIARSRSTATPTRFPSRARRPWRGRQPPGRGRPRQPLGPRDPGAAVRARDCPPSSVC